LAVLEQEDDRQDPGDQRGDHRHCDDEVVEVIDPRREGGARLREPKHPPQQILESPAAVHAVLPVVAAGVAAAVAATRAGRFFIAISLRQRTVRRPARAKNTSPAPMRMNPITNGAYRRVVGSYR